MLNIIFILLPRSCPGVGLGGAGGGESKTLARGFAMAPHRLRSSLQLLSKTLTSTLHLS